MLNDVDIAENLVRLDLRLPTPEHGTWTVEFRQNSLRMISETGMTLAFSHILHTQYIPDCLFELEPCTLLRNAMVIINHPDDDTKQADYDDFESEHLDIHCSHQALGNAMRQCLSHSQELADQNEIAEQVAHLHMLTQINLSCKSDNGLDGVVDMQMVRTASRCPSVTFLKLALRMLVDEEEKGHELMTDDSLRQLPENNSDPDIREQMVAFVKDLLRTKM